MVSWAGLVLIVFGVIAIMATSSNVYAQADNAYTSDQITLSEDLKNNPIAQDILKRIEQTKKVDRRA